jgi:plastocyanin domain-containing protein
MNKTALSIFLSALVIAIAIFLSGSPRRAPGTEVGVDNVSVVEGKQIVTITAKGGYTPRVTTAKADMPTIVRVVTRGTFDCSSALTIPGIGYRKMLPPSGNTDIELSPQKIGTSLQGVCSMGMYNFTIDFN